MMQNVIVEGSGGSSITYKELNKFQEAAHTVIDNTAKFVKDNKVGIITTIASGGIGAIKGAVKKTTFHVAKNQARKESLDLIKKGALKGAKDGTLKGVVTSAPVKIFLDPDSVLNETKVGKAINKEIDNTVNFLHKLVGAGLINYENR